MRVICGLSRLTSPEMGPVFEISGTERHQRRRESQSMFAPFVHEVEPIRKAATPLIFCVPACRIVASQRRFIVDRREQSISFQGAQVRELVGVTTTLVPKFAFCDQVFLNVTGHHPN
jgi:hypothetical protein